MPEVFVLISCSDNKRGGGDAYPADAVGVAQRLPHELTRELHTARRQVREWILQGRLIDSEKRQGNRATDPDNKQLTNGPDFGEESHGGTYLPAYERYSGRFFSQVPDRAMWDRAWRPGTRTLIISALYGLLLPGEPIQLYSCHLTDRLKGHEDKALITYWGPTITRILQELIAPGDSVVDLLSEETYQWAIDWKPFYRAGRNSCYHRCFNLIAGPESLVNLGRFYREKVLAKTITDLPLQYDKRRSFPYFDSDGDHKIQLLFENEIKTTRKQVMREGLGEVEPGLRDLYSTDVWSDLGEETKMMIINSESVYRRTRNLDGFDFTHASIGLAKAIEHWLNRRVVAPLVEDPKALRIRGKLLDDRHAKGNSLTLGEVHHFLGKVRGLEKCRRALPGDTLEELRKEIRKVKDDYRNSWVHAKSMSADTFEEFRSFAPDFFRKWHERGRR